MDKHISQLPVVNDGVPKVGDIVTMDGVPHKVRAYRPTGYELTQMENWPEGKPWAGIGKGHINTFTSEQVRYGKIWIRS